MMVITVKVMMCDVGDDVDWRKAKYREIEVVVVNIAVTIYNIHK